jgi:hypothetical protein
MIMTAFMAPAAYADADKDAKKESRRLQAQLSAAQKEKGMLTTQVEELKKQLGDVGSKSEVLEKKSGSQRKQLAEMTEKYQEADKKLQETQLLYADTSKSLQQLQTEKEQEHKRLSGDIQVCEKKNAELYQISVGLMEKYRSKGIISSLLLAEPFTQLERVKVQNVLQEYGDKAEAAKITSSKVPVTLPVGNTPANTAPGDAPAAAKGDSSKSEPSKAEQGKAEPSKAEPGIPAAASDAGSTGAIPTAAPVQVSNIAPANDATGAADNAPAADTGGKAQAEKGDK